MNAKRRKTSSRTNRLPLIIAAVALVAAAALAAYALLNRPEPASAVASASAPPAKAGPAKPSADARQKGSDPIGALIGDLPEGAAAGKALSEGPEGAPAWKRYASAAVSVPAGKPVIALVIDDVGLSKEKADEVIALPGPVTLSFLPYGDGVQALVDDARRAGHEVMLHLPMEPLSRKEDPGPDALTTELSDAVLQDRIAKNMDKIHGYVGFNNHMGSRFTADRTGMDAVMAAAHRRGLMFLDSRTTAKTLGAATAARYGVPAVQRDVFLDNVQDVAAVHAQLEKAVALAREKGRAVVIGHPHPTTIAALKSWIPSLRGVTLVPITAVLEPGQAGQAVASH
ncbi:MAG: divergent polysaccharide deacetylase family protein [Alphaproteobacteria bacterium]|nr:divergent polysaccharide deacetylase family protein [Alphaproteobacteria bacterium]